MISAIPLIPESLGVPRVVTGRAVTHLVGDPSLGPAEERAMRAAIVDRAMQALTTAVTSTTVFS